MYFLKNALLLIRSWAYALIRGAAKRVPTWGTESASNSNGPKKVLIIPASRLGDMVCATPIFHVIKKKYPDCEVIVAGFANCSTVHENNLDVDHYVTLDQHDFTANLAKIRGLKADVALVTTPSFEGTALLFLAGIKTIISPHVVNGFCPYQTKSYQMMMPLFISITHRMRHYAPREYLDMLRSLGIESEDTTKYVGFSKAAKQKMHATLVNKGISLETDFLVGISISAGNLIKKWPGERFAEVANHIASKHQAVVVFIGGKGDVAETVSTIAELKKLNPSARTIDMTGQCSIDELKALMSHFNLFVSVDTGPIYIAEALHVPTVDITGPIDELEQPPIGKFHKVVNIKNRKSPQLFVMNARVYDHAEAKRQVEEITVESVIAVVDELIHDIKKYSHMSSM